MASVFLPGSPFELYWNADDDRPPYDEDASCSLNSIASVTALLVGMIIYRYGLWVADISVTQITQESVREETRGTIGGESVIRAAQKVVSPPLSCPGVQSSLNYFMNLIKFALVIALPDDDTFGYLIIASFVFICLGGLSYSTFALSPSKVAKAAAEAEEKGKKTGTGNEGETADGMDNSAYDKEKY